MTDDYDEDNNNDERDVSGGRKRDEPRKIDAALRPRSLDDIYGQETLVENLRILIEAAKAREEAIDHILFYGPPGLGKTSLSHVMAHEMGVNIRVTAGPAIERAGELASILTNLRKGDILFIDEIHRLGRAVEEILYPAMEDFALDIIIGKGPTARNVRLKLPRFTVIGATTRLGLLTAPLRARFGAIYRMDFYSEEALAHIIGRAADMLNAAITQDGKEEIARRSRGTPRVALRLLRRVRDYADVRADGVITAQVAHEGLALRGIDVLGLDEGDRRYLSAVIEKFGGGPVGLDTIAAAISEETDTIMDVYEPYLLQLGFIDRTPRGRVATALAYDHLGYQDNRDDQLRLL
ncbi:MAG: Holliday junction branch migration DNA helicase RuvB [Chloroflexi bacterium]|nr:Holliday junction branch migration DNA helicase RuvB [Chloroflexota bacterium]